MNPLTSKPESTAVHLRDAAEADYAAIRALTLEAYRPYAAIMPRAVWGALYQAVTSVLDNLDRQDAEKIVAVRGDEVVGSVLLYPPTGADSYGQGNASLYPELRLLAVAPQARGLGLGHALVDECIRRARSLGAQKLGLHTSDYMEVATALYLKLGFVRATALDFEAAGPHTVKGYQLALS